jgi:hypothetical protein
MEPTRFLPARRDNSAAILCRICVEAVRSAGYSPRNEYESANEKIAGRSHLGDVDCGQLGPRRQSGCSGRRPTDLGGATAKNPEICRHDRRQGGIPAPDRTESGGYQRPQPEASRQRRRDRRSPGLFLPERPQPDRLHHLDAHRGQGFVIHVPDACGPETGSRIAPAQQRVPRRPRCPFRADTSDV